MILTTQQKNILLYFLASAAAIGLFVLFRNWSYDDPYITYRYAFNLAHGNGLVYNLGEKVLSTTSPLFAMVLACLGFLFTDFHRLAILIGCISVGISMVLFKQLCDLWKLPAAGWTGVFLLPTFSLLISTLGSETPLYIMLVLAILYAYLNDHTNAAGILAALLVLARPEGILLPVFLAVDFLAIRRKPIPWKGVGLFLCISLFAWGGIWLYFGSPIPATLSAKQQQGVMSISQGFASGLITVLNPYFSQPFFIAELVLSSLGALWIILKRSRALILVGWTLLYFFSYSLLGVTRYFWYYAPLVPGFILLAGAGLDFLNAQANKIIRLNRWGWLFSIVLLVPLFLMQGRALYRQSHYIDSRAGIYQSVGNWLHENTTADHKVGALEVGIIGFYAQRTMIDFAGLIQPDVSKQMTAKSTYSDTAKWAIEKYQPDYLVLYENAQKDLLEYYQKSGCGKEKEFRAEEYQFTDNLIVLSCNH